MMNDHEIGLANLVGMIDQPDAELEAARNAFMERETERIWNDPDLLQEVSCDTEFDPDTEFFGTLNEVLWNRNPGDSSNLLKIGKLLNELRDWLEPLVEARAVLAWENYNDGC